VSMALAPTMGRDLNIAQIRCEHCLDPSQDPRFSIVPRVGYGARSPTTMKRAPIKKPEDQYHHGDLRRALMSAALAMLQRSRGAVGELSLRAVAEKAGVSPGAPYHHFEDKTALLAAIAEDGFMELGAALASSVDNATDTALIERVARAYLGWAQAHPVHYRVMFLSELRESRFETVRAMATATLAQWAEWLRLSKRGRSAADAQVLAVTLWSAMHGFAQLAIDGLPGGHALEEGLITKLCALAER
jgi:AcrR family transcriptional regulator